MQKIGFCLFLFPAILFGTESVRVRLSWDYRNLPVKMFAYHADSPRLKLWETKTVRNFRDVPVADVMEDSTFSLKPGDRRRFVIVMRNATQKPVYFFAAPHQASPLEHSLGFKFKCLCVNHAFQVKPGEVWYRVVEFKLSPGFDGEALNITHTLVGISEKKMKDFELLSSR